MFEILFKYPAVIARYRAAPHADSCEHFLKDCANRGYSHAMLCKIAWVLLSVAPGINIDAGEVSLHDIELAVDQRTRFTRRSGHADGFRWSRQMFIHIATEWVQSLGCVVHVPKVERRFTEQLETFARHLRDERGLSPVTISTRHDHLTGFFERLASARDSIRAITIADVDAFIEDKGHQGWTRASLGTMASSLRSFFRYAQSQDWCLSGLAAAIESPRIYALEGIPQGPHWEDVQRLLSNADGDRHVDIRDRAILMLLSVYGLRRGEVAALRLDDLDWTSERILVTRPKQRCKQSYPLLAEAGDAILRYLREARPRCPHRALFLTIAAPVRPLSAASITAIAHARLTALDITLPSRGAHCLRHACASHLLASGFSLKQIGDHLGHRSANSTLHYTKVDLPGLRLVAELDLGSLL
jgi:site-specific recombinase XerD